MPNATLNLEALNYNYTEMPLIPFDTDIMYGCRDGMKFVKDLGLTSENATCRAGNLWDEPNGEFSPCAESELYFALGVVNFDICYLGHCLICQQLPLRLQNHYT